MMSLPTDCDQRDERLGWMGDANLSGDSIIVNFEAAAFIEFYMVRTSEGVEYSSVKVCIQMYTAKPK